MSEKFTCADLHFGHKNIVTFESSDGKKIRPFNSIEEHDQVLIDNWNKTVSKNDTTYILGDITLHKRNLPLLNQMNGKKKLILGNHDIYGYKEYSKYFYDIVNYRVNYNPKFVMSHIPIHESELDRFHFNIHGHTHSKNVLDKDGKIDERFICVSMEQINLTPVSFDILYKCISELRGKYYE